MGERRRWACVGAWALVAFGAGCNALFGIDDAEVIGPLSPPPMGGGGGGGGMGSGGGAGTGGGQGGGGSAGAPAFSVTLEGAPSRLVRGGLVEIGVRVTRAPNFSGSVQLRVTGLPSGLSATEGAVVPASTLGSVFVSASALATLGEAALTVQASAVGRGEHTLPAPLLVGDPPGALDQTFGGDGIVTTGTPARAKAIALQPDGKILVGGVNFSQPPATNEKWFLARYLPDGTPDPGFGSGGLVIDAVGAFERLALQPDGRIVAVGEIGGKLALVRFNADGDRDQSFGANGLATTAPGTLDTSHAYGVAVQGSGAIVVSAVKAPESDSVTLRFLPTGDLDSAFGTGSTGVVASPLRAFHTVALDQNDDILLGGIDQSGGGLMFGVTRLDKEGEPDATFGEGGNATLLDVPYVDTGLALQPDGKPVLSGYWLDGVNGYAFGRFNADGTPDATFGAAGVLRVEPADCSYSKGNGLAVQPDGKIVGVTTCGTPASGLRASVVRRLPDGSADPAFGAGGQLVLDDAAIDNFLFAVARQPDGRIVAAGSREGAGLMLVRVWD